MHRLIIDDPETVRGLEELARAEGTSVNGLLHDFVEERRKRTNGDAPGVPSVDALTTEYGLSPHIAEQLARNANLLEWTPETVAAEIAWQQKVRDNPETIGRRLPGWWEHLERITDWPEHIRATFKSEEEAPSYDEDGLPI